MKGLVEALRKGVRSGEYVGYRLITVHEEHIGITWGKKST